MTGRSSYRSDESADRSSTPDSLSSDIPDYDRRQLLAAIGSTGAVVLAGCIGDDAEENDAVAYQVTFPDQDETVDVEENEDLLTSALDAGVDIPYSCEVGSCGECTARYEGDANEVVTHDGNDFLEDGQIEDGWVLTCVAYAQDDFDLEVAHPDDE